MFRILLQTRKDTITLSFPIDFRSENKEKMKMAIFMGKYFDSKIHMFVAGTTDKGLAKKTKINLNFAIKYLIQNNIEYEIHEVPKKNFAQQTLDFAQKINADLILIVTTKNITFADYTFGASEQYIIANSSKIPVICVNPKVSFTKTRSVYGWMGRLRISLCIILAPVMQKQYSVYVNCSSGGYKVLWPAEGS